MKPFGWFSLLAVMAFSAVSFSLAGSSNTACLDVTTNGECHGASVPAELERLRVA
jgi:hypothetical protein